MAGAPRTKEHIGSWWLTSGFQKGVSWEMAKIKWPQGQVSLLNIYNEVSKQYLGSMVFPKIYARLDSCMPLVVTKFNVLFWKSQNDFVKPYDCSILIHLCFKAKDQQTMVHFPPVFTSKISLAQMPIPLSMT